jgi:hypothetical protein
MAEEFVQDIISAAETKDSSSTEATTTTDKAAEDVVIAKSGDDQSSNQTKIIERNADSDQTKLGPSVEELAAQLGWRADHVGEDAVDAATYILKSKDIQKAMSKHNKDLKENLSAVQASVNALKEHNEKVYQAEVKKLTSEIESLKKERKSAIELADVNKVEELDAQIEAKKNDLAAPKINDSSKSNAVENSVYDEWIKENQWYLEDNEMAQFADHVAQNYVGAPLQRIYALVRQKVQEVFPDKFDSFEDKVKNQITKIAQQVVKPVGPVSPVDKGSNNKGASTSFSKSDLTPEQVSIMNQFVRGGIMSEQQYIDDIAKMQE